MCIKMYRQQIHVVHNLIVITDKLLTVVKIRVLSIDSMKQNGSPLEKNHFKFYLSSLLFQPKTLEFYEIFFSKLHTYFSK